MQTLNLKLPIQIVGSEKEGYVITDAENSEFFFNVGAEGNLVYDGCCVEVENKDIVMSHLKK